VPVFEAETGFELEVSGTWPGARKEKVPTGAQVHPEPRMP
jgi:hypothetical protein